MLLLNIKVLCIVPPNKPPGWDRWKFNQKIIWRGLHLDPRIPYAALVDKIKVKQLLQDHITCAKTYFITDDPSQICLENLPKTFMMKSNAASGRGILVKNGIVIATRKREGNFKPIPCTDEFLRSYAKKWQSRIFAENHEMQYSLIKPMIFFEEYIEDITYELELYFFNGKVRVITLFFVNGYQQKPEVSYYDANWNLFDIKHPSFRVRRNPIEKPAYLDELIAFSERLVSKIDHVRVDFFISRDKVYFGEFTFTTAGGYNIDHLNTMVGSYWAFPDPQASLENPYLNIMLNRLNSFEESMEGP